MQLPATALIRLFPVILLPILLTACYDVDESVTRALTTGAGEESITTSKDSGDSNLSERRSWSRDKRDRRVISTLTGSVGDGPVIGATIQVFDKNHQLLATSASTDSATYELTIKTSRKSYPILIQATGGIDRVTNAPADFTLKSAVPTPKKKNRVNINSFTTVITETANAMPGGLTRNNFTEATNIVLSKFSFGLDTLLVPDPVVTPIDNTNVAALVK